MINLFALIPAPSTNSIGFVRIYGLTMATAIAVAILVSHKRYAKKHDGSNLIIDIFLPVVLAGIAGARIYHLFTGYDWDEGGLVGTIKLRNGGLSIWGAVIGGALMVAYLAKKKRASFIEIGEAVAVGLLFAQAIGRFGNYFNQELFGRELHAPWALKVDLAYRPTGFENVATFHPTFLYEALWCILLACLIVFLEKKVSPWPRGASLALYIGGYCLGRSIFEYLRIDDATKLFGVRFNLMLSIVLCVLGLAAFINLMVKRSKLLTKSAGAPLESENQ